MTNDIDSSSIPPVIPDETNDMAAASAESKPTYTLTESQRNYIANLLTQAGALISDTTPDSQRWNTDQAMVCVRSALRALAKAGAR